MCVDVGLMPVINFLLLYLIIVRFRKILIDYGAATPLKLGIKPISQFNYQLSMTSQHRFFDVSLTSRASLRLDPTHCGMEFCFLWGNC